METEAQDVFFYPEEDSPEVLYKEKSSKFFGYVFSVTSEQEIKDKLENLRKQHHNARHHCYAWQLGTEVKSHRSNDDGEPSGSAGLPIFGQIQSFDVTQVLVVVVRYFGGTKLGMGGLISAYKECARLALEAASIKMGTINRTFDLHFDYPDMDFVMRLVKEHDLILVEQQLELSCRIRIAVRKKDVDKILNQLAEAYKIQVVALED